MRVTNQMITNNLLRNLNNGMTKVDKYLNQMASGKKNSHISDDPVALIYGQTARNSLARLEHYQSSVDSAQDWLMQVEAGMVDLERRLADVYNSVIDAATDVKSESDKNNIAQLVGQLRDHYLDTLNATFGDKFMYAGYNTPGNERGTGSITGPFTLAPDSWDLLYNGQNLSNFLQISIDGTSVNPSEVSGIFGGLYINLSSIGIDITDSHAANLAKVENAVNAVIIEIDDLTNDILGLNAAVTAKADAAAEYYRDNIHPIQSRIDNIESEIAIRELPIYDPEYIAFQEELHGLRDDLHNAQPGYTNALLDLADLRTQREDKIKELARLIDIDQPNYYDASGNYNENNPVSITVGGVDLLGNFGTLVNPVEVDLAALEEMTDMLIMVNTLKSDVLTFNVGPGVTMQVTVNGLDLVLYEAERNNGSYSTFNIFNVLHEVYKACSSGADAEEIGNFVMPLQKAQNHILAKIAEVGGRTRRLDLLSARYEQDYINYMRMMSDAEDVEFDEAAMNYATAQTIYQAALAAGSRAIQMSLMDFLR